MCLFLKKMYNSAVFFDHFHIFSHLLLFEFVCFALDFAQSIFMEIDDVEFGIEIVRTVGNFQVKASR